MSQYLGTLVIVNTNNSKYSGNSWSKCHGVEIFIHIFLAHLARRAIVTYCYTNVSGARCAVRQHLKTNILFYKTTGPTVLEFHMEHVLTSGSQNCKIGSGRISKMAAVTKNSKNNQIDFFSRTTGYFMLNFGMEYQWNIRLQNCKNEKKNL